MELEFYGAADRVTGSCHIIHIRGRRLLLDCGFIQGSRQAQSLNYQDFPFDIKQVDAVVLSHAHLDHSGRLPLLVNRGYKGAIYAQNASCDMLKVLLEDAARIQQEDAKNENRWRSRKNKELIQPLYEVKDVSSVFKQLVGCKYREKQQILPGVTVRFQDAGHILGSSSVELWLEEDGVQRKVVFSGDLGQYNSPILNDPASIEEADLILMESTYGDRHHRDRQDTVDEIAGIIAQADKDNGNIVIPAFALGRSQDLLYMLGSHYQQWNLKNWQIYLNSPMAIEATAIYWNYPHLYDEDATRLRKQINEMPAIKNLHLTKSAKESKAINKVKHHAIILAASGMMTAGRILHHLKQNLPNPNSHIIVAGYQGRGTLGREIVEGANSVKIHNKSIPVNAQIHTVGGLSAHADQADLLRWLGCFKTKPHVCIIHGEQKAREGLQKKIAKRLGLGVTFGQIGDRIDLSTL